MVASASVSDKAAQLNELAKACYEEENDSCIWFARKALSYAIRHRQPGQQLVAHLHLAESYRKQDRLEEATLELQHATRILSRISGKRYLPQLLLVKGNIAASRLRPGHAASCYRKGYRLSKINAPGLEADFCLAIANTIHGAGENERAYLEKARVAAHRRGQYHQEIIALNNLGMHAAGAHVFEDARNYFKRSLALAEKHGDLKAQSRAHLNIGNLDYYKGDWRAAIDCYIKSASLKEQMKDKAGIAMVHNNIATIYKEQKRYAKSLEYYRKTSAYYERSGDSLLLAETWINEAIVHIFTGDRTTGIRLLKKALRFPGIEKLPDVTLIAYTNLAFAYTETGCHEKALYYLKTAEKIARALNDRHSIVFIANLYGANYFFLRSYRKAVRYYRQSYELGKELGLLNEQKKALFGLYETEQETGNYQQALIWHEQYVRITDSLFDSVSQQQLTELEEKYDTRQKIQEIGHLHSRNNAISLSSKLTSNRLKLSLMSIALIVLIAIFLGWFFYQRSKRQQLLLANTREKMHQLLQRQEIQLLEMTLQAQQSERKKLAKDIHDNLGSYLATLKYQHEACFPRENEELAAHYRTTSNLIAEACAEVRSISHRMADGNAFSFSLIPALQELIGRIGTTKQFGLHFFHFPEELSLPHECEVALYKMIQELLSNILRHAGAAQVELQIYQSETAVSVLLEDDGRGFNPQTAPVGIGLTNIRERLAAFDGKLEINSSLHQGTTVVLFIPLNPEDI